MPWGVPIAFGVIFFVLIGIPELKKWWRARRK